MLKLQVIGNLGSDAVVRNEGGGKFVSLSIAHTDKRKDESGREVERTTWVSATLNGDGGNLLKYLTKGTKVFASGDMGLRLFHSEKERRMVAGVNLYIRDIELINVNTDEVPRDLYDTDGVAHAINKYYFCADCKDCELMDRRGSHFIVNKDGWVAPMSERTNETQQQQNETVSNETNDEPN